MIHSLKLDNRKLVTDFTTEPQIGDVLQMREGGFARLGNIRKSITGFDQYITSETTAKNIEHINEGGTQATFNFSGSVPMIAQGDKKHARFVALKNVTIDELDYLAVADQVEAFWKKHEFHKPIIRRKTFLIGTVLKAQSGTYVYSMTANNRIALSGKGNISVSGIPLALEGKLDVRFEKSLCQKIISEKPINCIFQALTKLSGGYAPLG
jgi:hypothetical protein